jgi:hypothetical protein
MKDAPTFHAFHKKYDDQVARRWFEYANAVEGKYLDSVFALRSLLFSLLEYRVKANYQVALNIINDSDKPLLTEYNSKWSVATIADILTSYLDQMWCKCCPV